MTVMDDIHRLREIASSDRVPSAAIRAIQEAMYNTNAEIAAILGPALMSGRGIAVTADGVQRRLDAAVAACDEYRSAINDVADALAKAGT